MLCSVYEFYHFMGKVREIDCLENRSLGLGLAKNRACILQTVVAKSIGEVKQNAAFHITLLWFMMISYKVCYWAQNAMTGLI